MNKKYFLLWLTIITIGIALFCACREKPETEKPVTGVSLDKKELILSPGDTETLVATVYPDDATNNKVTWKSSNTNVAEVSNVGLITAISDGKAIITVTTKDGNHKAECSVTVEDYRDKWVGSYDCELISIFGTDSHTYEQRYQTVVIITMLRDSMLYIEDSKYHYIDREIKVDCNGHFPPNSIYNGKYLGEFLFNGKFANDSIYVHKLEISPGGYGDELKYSGNKL